MSNQSFKLLIDKHDLVPANLAFWFAWSMIEDLLFEQDDSGINFITFAERLTSWSMNETLASYSQNPCVLGDKRCPIAPLKQY